MELSLTKKIPIPPTINMVIKKPSLMTHLPSTIRGLIDYFDGIIACKEPNLLFRNSDIEYILTYHPNYAEKQLGFVAHMVVIFSKEARLKKTRLYVLLVNNVDGLVCAEDYVSLNRCIINAINPVGEAAIRTTHIILAFYNTVRGYPIGFGRVFPDICTVCKDIRNVFIHCQEPNETFESFVVKFLDDMTPLSLMDVEISITRAGIMLRDNELIRKWTNYYTARHETLIYICYKCYNTSYSAISRVIESVNEEEAEEEDPMITSPHISARSNHTEVSLKIDIPNNNNNSDDYAPDEKKDSDDDDNNNTTILEKNELRDGDDNIIIYTKNENGRFNIT